MTMQQKIHLSGEWVSKDVVERLVKENLENKLDNYLIKFEKKDDAETDIDLFIDRNKKWLFNWKLLVNIDWKSYRYEREDYKKLDDLVNHFFDHLKEDLAKK